MKPKEEGIEIFIEGGTTVEQRVLTMVVNEALQKTGFTDTHQMNYQGQECAYNKEQHTRIFPSVMDHMRSHSPGLFRTPIIVSAYAPEPRQHERRRLDHATIQAVAMATSYADPDPDETWAQLDQEQKSQIIRRVSEEQFAYA